mgnify:CR=1 FL=1
MRIPVQLDTQFGNEDKQIGGSGQGRLIGYCHGLSRADALRLRWLTSDLTGAHEVSAWPIPMDMCVRVEEAVKQHDRFPPNIAHVFARRCELLS